MAQSSTGGGDCSASRLTAARDRLARKQQEINDLREKIGPLAAEQYRTGAVDPSVQLFLSSDRRIPRQGPRPSAVPATDRQPHCGHWRTSSGKSPRAG
ncbi:hypothetical protein [Streptomyces nigra]|uniref:hypothetical protein n=1 Tax=Streptomyces nigra TaxID=1827580 RepID=UPI00382FCFA1